jgi:hypothetical protein
MAGAAECSARIMSKEAAIAGSASKSVYTERPNNWGYAGCPVWITPGSSAMARSIRPANPPVSRVLRKPDGYPLSRSTEKSVKPYRPLSDSAKTSRIHRYRISRRIASRFDPAAAARLSAESQPWAIRSARPRDAAARRAYAGTRSSISTRPQGCDGDSLCINRYRPRPVWCHVR